MRLKFTLLEIFVIVATIGVLIALILPGPDQDRSHRYPSSVVIGANLTKVAGDYYQGDGRGRNWHLSILPDGRYSFVSSGCTGVHHREAGQAREVKGRIELSPEKQNTKKVDRDLLPIRWDERTYLIRPDELPEFCEVIIAGKEPRNELRGSFYLSNEGLADGLPDVPEKWLDYLRARLKIGKIIEVNNGIRAKVALGSKQGLKVGDLLKLQGETVLGELRVTAVEDTSCLTEVLYPNENPEALKPGRNVIIARDEITPPDQ